MLIRTIALGLMLINLLACSNAERPQAQVTKLTLSLDSIFESRVAEIRQSETISVERYLRQFHDIFSERKTAPDEMSRHWLLKSELYCRQVCWYFFQRALQFEDNAATLEDCSEIDFAQRMTFNANSQVMGSIFFGDYGTGVMVDDNCYRLEIDIHDFLVNPLSVAESKD